MPEPAVERHTVAPDVDLVVRRWDGDGTPFLLVHGLASNARLWDGVATFLAEAGHAVAAVDQRGHGRSSKPGSGYDFTTITDDLTALISSLGWDDARPVVAGQSWGGNVVLELAWRSPSLMGAAVLVDGGTIDLARRFPDWDSCREAMAPPRLEGTPLSTMEEYMRTGHPTWPESGIQGALACFEVREDGTVKPWLALEHHLQILEAMYGHHPADRYAEVQAPVTLLTAQSAEPGGEEDPWTSAKRAAVDEAMALLPHGRSVWMTGDHDLHAQFPAEVANVLMEALP